MARAEQPLGAVVLVAALALTSGCAAMLKQPPAENRPVGEPPVCSTTRAGVALDVIMAVALGAGGLVAAANDEPAGGLALGAVGGLFVASAVSGHRSAERCEDAVDEFKMETARQPLPTDRHLVRPTARAAPRVPAPVLTRPPARPAAPTSDPAPAAPPPETKPAAPAARERGDWSDFWVEVPQ